MIEVTRRQNQEPDAEEIKEFDELEKLMAAEETKKETREKSATDIIHEVAEEMCMHYCKYPEQWDEETQGDLFDSEYCQNCPLERLC